MKLPYLDTAKLYLLDQRQLAELKQAVDEEADRRFSDWDRYIEYLRQWADDNADPAYAGQSPACYDEWHDYEGAEDV